MKISIIGLGLIGASLATCLKASNAEATLIGYDQSEQATISALAKGTIDQAATTVEEAIADADMVILAVFVEAIKHILADIGPMLKPGAIVLDVGSTKAQIVEAMNLLPNAVQAVGGHPMTGRLTQGVDTASANLFQGRIFALCPTQHTTVDTKNIITGFVESLGAQPLWLDAYKHDEYVAMVSHLSRLLPIAVITAADQKDDLIWQLAAGSFRETTRLASEPLGFWRDVFATNPAGIATTLRDVAAQLEHFAQLIEANDIDSIADQSQQAEQIWQRLYGASQQGEKNA
ncbi:MAG: prephenate dehydrogenase/arogenate dehydrogenase family protein [Anaerolineae bacterium]|nr:prephenate dehydrogenase/arogenate dehydrogenase family protein [Anaerolineae bacterium]